MDEEKMMRFVVVVGRVWKEVMIFIGIDKMVLLYFDIYYIMLVCCLYILG